MNRLSCNYMDNKLGCFNNQPIKSDYMFLAPKRPLFSQSLKKPMNDIEKLIAREKIERQLYKYCRSLDQKDWQALRACFGEEHVHKHGSYTGDLDGFIHFAKQVGERMHVAHHSISNLMVDVGDDLLSATTQAYFSAVHKIDGSKISEMYFFTDDIEEVDSDWMVAGYYNDRWIFRDEKWLIVERNARHVWERLAPITPEIL